MDFRRLIALGLLCAGLAGCGDRSLHLKVHYRDAAGLRPGAAVLYEQRQIGRVIAVEPAPQGGFLVGVDVSEKFAAAATADSKFYIAEAKDEPGASLIEIEQSKLGGPVLADGSVVEGSERLTSLIPFGEIFRQFSDGLRGMREKVEQFQKDLQRLPDSEEGKRLQQEWRRLTEEIEKAQGQAEESVKKDVLPKLEAEMERLRERFKRVEPKNPAAPPSKRI